MKTNNLNLKVLMMLGVGLLMSNIASAATYYVRTDGGTSAQCTGLVDAPYSGTGSLQPCAFNHPNWVLAPIGSNPTKMVGGDTMVIDGSNSAQYMVGYGSPNTGDTTKCHSGWPWDCYSRAVPSGPDAAHPTRILGKGWDSTCATPPQLWGNERVFTVMNMTGSNNVELQCLEVTDHSACQEYGPNACPHSYYPYGAWASKGLIASDSSNVLIKNVNIHGIAHTGVHAARLKDWTILNSSIVANSFVGWNGDIGVGASSNSGTMTFDHVKIAYNGCGETYPDKKPYNCYSQSQGGYGDGLGTQQTGGNWIFTNSDISHNTSDGVDLLYHNGTGTVTINRVRAEGNAGNQVKIATNTTIDNSVLIGNCAFFNGNAITSTVGGFDNCRGSGSTIAAAFKPGMNVTVRNSTITSNGDTSIMSSGSTCNGTEVLKSLNNIFLGAPDYNGGDISALYYAAGATGNSDGTCGTLKLTDDYSVIYGTKYIADDCAGKAHSKCVDPKMVEPIVPYYKGDAYNVNLQSTSPAAGAALVISGASSLDFSGYDRGASWDIGALDLKVAATPAPTTTTTTTVVTTPTTTTTTTTTAVKTPKWKSFFKRN